MLRHVFLLTVLMWTVFKKKKKKLTDQWVTCSFCLFKPKMRWRCIMFETRTRRQSGCKVTAEAIIPPAAFYVVNNNQWLYFYLLSKQIKLTEHEEPESNDLIPASHVYHINAQDSLLWNVRLSPWYCNYFWFIHTYCFYFICTAAGRDLYHAVLEISH